MQAENAIVASLEGVTKTYGGHPALREVSLEVRAGSLTAVLGPNGAGKTTAVRLLLGLTRPDAGRIAVFGQDPRQASARGRLGAMLQVAKVPETLKVKEHLELFRSYYAHPLPMTTILEAAGLGGLENRLFGVLSGGQKQRVLFALAICGNPDLLFLDEPTLGLDLATRHLIWHQIRLLVQQGRTVVLTTHYLEEVDALADRVVLLKGGVIQADGTAAELKARTALRRIRCVTRLAPFEAARIPQVCGVAVQEGRLELRTAHAEAVVRELLALDPQLSRLEVADGTLEDAFLKLVAEGSPEAALEVSA